ncbi:MAG: anti-sigma factor [Chloroflexi bacterium]|nr:anti-sigma factor [Chloroflexota bacterium]
MSLCKELEELYPAFALDAVDEQDKKNIENHLKTCQNCSEIVEDYRSVSDMLPFAVPMVDPPDYLKARVLAATVSPHIVQPRISIWQTLVAGFTNTLRSPAFAAVTMLLVLGLGIWNISLQTQLNQQQAANQQMASEVTRQRALVSTIAYADTQPKRMEATSSAPQAVGRLYAAPELNAMALIVYDMPTLQSNQVYQIWLIDPNGDRTSGGTFSVDNAGRGWVLIRAPKSLKNYEGVGITVEPAGGSPKPTGPKMMGTNL